jgi:hypothetical protein
MRPEEAWYSIVITGAGRCVYDNSQTIFCKIVLFFVFQKPPVTAV